MLSDLSTGVSSTRTQSTTSIATIQTAATTPEFFPSLVESEVGNLLHANLFSLDQREVADEDTESATTELVTDVSEPEREKWVICLVGLPASGKSTVAEHLETYVNRVRRADLRFKSFNAGNVRRRYEKQLTRKFDFDFTKSATQRLRELYAFEALNELTSSLIRDEIDVGVFDATNTTKERREKVVQTIRQTASEANVVINIAILEVCCSNISLRRYNIERKTTNKDYYGMPREEAITDFLKRVEKYEKIHEKVTLDEIDQLDVNYFIMSNVGESFSHNCGRKSNGKNNVGRFESVLLQHIYDFLLHYRSTFGQQYLSEVEKFYKDGYKPIKQALATNEYTVHNV
ncbi:hypothetical protein KL928_000598 [Ogataea angusta]|uniref:6-phosphofructo-2-kinase domain-containing protein n=1 Tax=Pichia angusta TaxID=870730 RepID=A0AAN6DLV2_PICAN|nr:uncharacterized protein KL928_000598 [Ogataea angusta]KAG7822123.1 hypothetical protein KL928_000598 [Ogataea angusta]KAG7862874.1 hypothetical protein KL939_000193 [Ogataea angusta]